MERRMALSFNDERILSDTVNLCDMDVLNIIYDLRDYSRRINVVDDAEVDEIMGRLIALNRRVIEHNSAEFNRMNVYLSQAVNFTTTNDRRILMARRVDEMIDLFTEVQKVFGYRR